MRMDSNAVVVTRNKLNLNTDDIWSNGNFAICTYRGEDRCGVIKRAGELPLLASFVRFRLQHHCFHDLEVVLAYIVFSYDHFLNGCKQNERSD